MPTGSAPVSAGSGPATGGSPGPDLARLRISRDGAGPRRGGGARWPLVLLLLLLVGGGAWAYLTGRITLRTQASALEVSVVRVPRPGEATPVRGETMGNGYVVARQKAALSTVLSGRLVEMNVEEGSLVKEGDVVARIQHDDFDTALAQAKKDISVAQARETEATRSLEASRLDLVRLKGDNAVLSDLVRQTEVETERAKREVERNRDLHEKDVIDDATWDRLVAAADTANATLVAAKGRVAAARAAETAWEGEMARREAAVATAHAEIERLRQAERYAEIQLEKTYVRAPFDGIVIQKGAELGEVVAATGFGGNSRGSVATIVNAATLEAQIELSETRFGTISEGDPARITIDSSAERSWPGRVRKILPAADRQKATIEIRVEFLERPPTLKPDMGLRVAFLPKDTKPTAGGPQKIRIPARAVITRDGKSEVFVVESGVVRRVPVVVGATAEGTTEVESGLSGGESVVVDAPADLRDGARVVPKEVR
jgi:RND family efflux transporter MFP subunit